MTTTLDELVTSARLSGRIDVLMEIREWLNEKIDGAEKANEQLRENLQSRKAQESSEYIGTTPTR